MRLRITQDLDQLKLVYSNLEHKEVEGEDWIYIPRYPVPKGWQISGQTIRSAPVAFLVKADYPGEAPYGFLMPKSITFKGSPPGSTGVPPIPVPFPGDWIHFSWLAENWASDSDTCLVSNLITWCRSFLVRLKEGA